MLVPEDFVVPRELVTERFRLEPLGPQHNDSDYAAWTSSIDHIHATPGFESRRWPPPGGMSPAQNLEDLREHAEEFENRTGFTSTVIETGTGEVIGCVYIYPSGVRSWVRADRAELDKPLYEAVREWLAGWPLATVDYAPR